MSWTSVQIEKACLPTRIRDLRDSPEALFRYVDISSIDRGLKTITSTSEIFGKDAPSRARKEIRAGNILVSTVRPNLNAVAIVPPELDGHIASTGFCVLQPNSQMIDGKYLFYFTLTPDFIGILSSKVRGAHYPAVSDRDVKEIELPLPPLSEQRRIVEILDQADMLLKKRAETDGKVARIMPALFYKMFGDPATNPKGWPIYTLGELSIGPPQYGANARAIDYHEGMPRYVRITDITEDGRLSHSEIRTPDLADWEPYRLVDGDILFARSGATVGKTYLYQPDDGLCAYAGYLIRFQLNMATINPWVVFAFTRTPFYQSWVTSKRRTAAQPNINGQEYASLRIATPSLETQKKFVEAAREVRTLYKKRQEARNGLENLFSLMLHRAFTGELTAKWCEAHIKELLAEMGAHAKTIDGKAMEIAR